MRNLEIGDDVLTPLKRPATVTGFKDGRVMLKYIDTRKRPDDTVLLQPCLVKFAPHGK